METNDHPTGRDLRIVEDLERIGSAIADLRSAYPAPRIDVGIEVTADGCFYTASIWVSLVRPVRVESMHAGEVIEAMFTIVEALA